MIIFTTIFMLNILLKSDTIILEVSKIMSPDLVDEFYVCPAVMGRLTTRALLPSLPLLRQKLHQRVTSAASKLSPEIR